MSKESKSIEVTIAEISKDVSYLRLKVDAIDTKISADYVTKTEFDPVKRIVYGLVGVVGAAVAMAIVNLVITK